MVRRVGLGKKRQTWMGGDGRTRVRVTVSLLADDYEWIVKRGLVFSAILSRKIHELRASDIALDADEAVSRMRIERESRQTIRMRQVTPEAVR